MGYLDFLDLVLEEEVGVREGRRFRNALKLSGLPHHKGLDGFDFAFQPDLDARKVRDLAALGFVEPRPTSASSAHPGSARPCSRSAWPSPPARPASRSTSPPWTTWSATSRRPRPPGGSPRSSRPTSNPPCSWSTRSAICRWPAPTPTWSSSWSPAATSAAHPGHLQQGLQRVGQRLRRRRARLGHPGPAAAPLRRHLHQRAQLPAQGPPQALERRWCPGVILLALLPTYEPVPETTSA